MPGLSPFTPQETIAVTVAAASAAVALPSPRGDQVIIKSLAANAIAFVALGTASTTVAIPTATEQNGFPILPGEKVTLTRGDAITHIATIGTVANTLYVSVGDGQ